jgi:replicative DNA helicase
MVKKEIKNQFAVLKQNPNFRFSECASISLTQVKQDIKKFQQDIGQEYMVVVFDLLSMIKEFMITDEKGMNFAQGIEVAINVLNAMAKELGVHYIAVLQMNRNTIYIINYLKVALRKRRKIK